MNHPKTLLAMTLLGGWMLLVLVTLTLTVAHWR
jgi:hypothetical protein